MLRQYHFECFEFCFGVFMPCDFKIMKDIFVYFIFYSDHFFWENGEHKIPPLFDMVSSFSLRQSKCFTCEILKNNFEKAHFHIFLAHYRNVLEEN